MVYILVEIVTKHIKQELIFNFLAALNVKSLISAAITAFTAILKVSRFFSIFAAVKLSRRLITLADQRVNFQFGLGDNRRFLSVRRCGAASSGDSIKYHPLRVLPHASLGLTLFPTGFRPFKNKAR
ncbi:MULTISPECIES: hypothetical protein [Pantoea]|uniref:hypothetical protein n=1 Tax=Pantoea TaxID=53335 RepID=UPI002892A8CC|nr:hypothetical protein [Pantoea sp. UBA5923]